MVSTKTANSRGGRTQPIHEQGLSLGNHCFEASSARGAHATLVPGSRGYALPSSTSACSAYVFTARSQTSLHPAIYAPVRTQGRKATAALETSTMLPAAGRVTVSFWGWDCLKRSSATCNTPVRLRSVGLAVAAVSECLDAARNPGRHSAKYCARLAGTSGMKPGSAGQPTCCKALPKARLGQRIAAGASR